MSYDLLNHVTTMVDGLGASAYAYDAAGQLLSEDGLQRDDQPRTLTLPPALKKALAASPRAKAVFDKLSYSHQKEHAEWIAGAKQEDTVKRRLEKLIPLLLAKDSAQT